MGEIIAVFIRLVQRNPSRSDIVNNTRIQFCLTRAVVPGNHELTPTLRFPSAGAFIRAS
jgi:hypothetical protein